MLGAIYLNNGTPVVRQYTVAPVVKTATTDEVAKNLIDQILRTPKGQQLLTRFLTQKPGFWKPIISNTRLTPSQKFKKIFGVDFLDIFAPNGLSGLGNIFEDIGNWFNQGGAERLALQIQNTSSSIAKALNVLRNQQSNVETQQSMNDLTSNAYLKTTSFIQDYGIWIIGGLAVLLLIKK